MCGHTELRPSCRSLPSCLSQQIYSLSNVTALPSAAWSPRYPHLFVRLQSWRWCLALLGLQVMKLGGLEILDGWMDGQVEVYK